MSLSGDRIRELRIQHDMTLDDVARYLGINRQAVYKYEQGIVTNIPLDKIEKMADLFGTTPDYIAGWTNNPKKYEMNLQLFGDDFSPESSAPQTLEARIVSGGMDKLPQEQREQILNVVRAMFIQHPELFDSEEGTKE